MKKAYLALTVAAGLFAASCSSTTKKAEADAQTEKAPVEEVVAEATPAEEETMVADSVEAIVDSAAAVVEEEMPAEMAK